MNLFAYCKQVSFVFCSFSPYIDKLASRRNKAVLNFVNTTSQVLRHSHFVNCYNLFFCLQLEEEKPLICYVRIKTSGCVQLSTCSEGKVCVHVKELPCSLLIHF